VPAVLLPRRGFFRNLRGEVAVALHRLLENPDRTRERADLVAAGSVRHLDPIGAVGDLLDRGGDDRQRTGDRARDDDDAEYAKQQREAGKAGQHEGELLVEVGLLGNPPGALGIDLGKRLEILVQRRADRAVGVIVAPFAARGRAHLFGTAYQLLAEID